MISFVRVTRSNDPMLDNLVNLLYNEFEVHQLRPLKQLKNVIDTQPNHYFTAIVFNKKVVGVIVYWKLLNSFFYIEHFAVFSEFRGEKIGQKVMDHINNTIGGLWLLEIDPIGDVVHDRLRKWYEKNKFTVTKLNHKQPPYVANEGTTPLHIMTNKPTNKLDLYLSTITKEVYQVGYKFTRE
ncbi:hypothetical protein EIN_131920 [Entamoeba invadens IP1]|uniref:N-acetyltransferase domain-containing protein n=1 Tax=Entamoeba invadens IP1 TaxID=370355 RepID=A0A0A1UH00_ENTIV|nr:hypothetical protein EIN_131920 [Entamoeba invadens IP1]ELP94343.1 hypothetical protein EIN_131920 [Entamoeba invadens IP1]|eukprot:XP_004261114.1 hypothetical protein EIN_131920 [Entamoeba invadens IP1]